jgi:hypothetical protein
MFLRNSMLYSPDLLSRLIDRLPEIAAEMPEIRELRVLQTGDSDAAFDALASFIAKIVALAESLGIPLKLDKAE